MSTQDHYNTHLAHIYSWMMGDFEARVDEFGEFLRLHGIVPGVPEALAIDLGAGHGIQSVALARAGFSVVAVDCNAQLLQEIEENSRGYAVEIIDGDMRQVRAFAEREPELIVCCGDTLAHLESMDDVRKFIADCAQTLAQGGLLLLSFRDYSHALTGDERFIPVKSDDSRILTCILDYSDDAVRVTDLLHEKSAGGWTQKVSSYHKVRLRTERVIACIEEQGMTVRVHQTVNRMVYILAVKSSFIF